MTHVSGRARCYNRANMETPKPYNVPQTPEAMKAYFDAQRKIQEAREVPKPAAGRGDSAKRPEAPAAPDMHGFRNRLEALSTSLDLSRRSTRERPDETAAVDVKRFLEERNAKNDWARVDYPAGMFRYLRDLRAKLADPGMREQLPRGDELKAAVEKALDQFE